jgi:branched-chain amino acid aminotransferase
MKMEFSFTKNESPKLKPEQNDLGFGRYYSDHMLIIDHNEEKGWHKGRIIPYGNLSLDPASMVFHYALEVFEGLKAYCAADGRALIFRPDANGRRLNSSLRRLCMPELPLNIFVEAVKAIVKADRDWMPAAPGTSLYIRPFVIADEPHIGVRRSATHKFIIILSPVGAYYPEGLNPVKIYVEEEYTRAVPGGTGMTKCGGNYAASIASQYKAKENGYTQVLWLDGLRREYIEEVGTMNVMFKINGKIITPALNGSILPGITRDSVIQMLKKMNVPLEERAVSAAEIIEAAEKGDLEEAFGTGTAAVISPIGELFIGGKKHLINNNETGALARRLYDDLTAIQWGTAADEFGWMTEVR